MRWAVFLDRDGVIVDPVPDPADGRPESPYRPEDVALAPGAVAGLHLLRGLGALLVMVSNQPSAAKGTCTPEALAEVHEAMRRPPRRRGARARRRPLLLPPPRGHGSRARTRVRLPQARARDAARRGGGPGLDLGRSWMIGDSDADIEAGRRAGCRTVLVEHPGSTHRRGEAVPDARAADLLQAARLVAGGVGRPPT